MSLLMALGGSPSLQQKVTGLSYIRSLLVAPSPSTKLMQHPGLQDLLKGILE